MSKQKEQSYQLVRGSDVVRDGMYLERNDGRTESKALAEVFYSDVDESMTISTFGNTLPVSVIERLIVEAKISLPPAPGQKA